MKCPKCSAEMQSLTYSGNPVKCCTGCKGLWLSTESFEVLKHDEWLAQHIDEGSVMQGRKFNAAVEVRCPSCSELMLQIVDEKQPHILYERCPADCGVFFDAGEFSDLTAETFWDKFKPSKKPK